VLVAPGTYVGEWNRGLDFGVKNITLRSEGGAEVTSIDCEHQDRAFHFHGGQDAASLVEGFTIVNGNAEMGGGIYCDQSSPSIASCTFSGGAAANGGAVYGDHSSPTITDCAFIGNMADRHDGAMRFVSFCSAAITGCTFSENRAQNGGGILTYGYEPTVTGSIFSGNSAGGLGGGLYCVWGWLTVTSCTLYGNSAGGLGGGMCCDDAAAVITNTIVSFSLEGGAIACEGDVVPEITRCCVFGNVGAAGDSLCGVYYENLFADPAFCDAEGGDFSLHAESPCMPPNNPWNELIGALGLGCGQSVVEPTSWGALKARFR
jgi:hypothetical protein